jgi:radical SAM superfamily enzyme
MLAYANFLNHLEVEFVKIHHLHVVQGTALAQAYLADPFPTLDFPSWVSLVCDFLERLSSRIVVQRLFGWAPETEVLAPRWGLSRTEIKQGILSELERRDTRQGKLAPIA